MDHVVLLKQGAVFDAGSPDQVLTSDMLSRLFDCRVTVVRQDGRFVASVDGWGHGMDLKAMLDRLYARYNHSLFIPPDPLQFVYQYTDPADQEVVAFLASGLAYGRVEQIEQSLRRLFLSWARVPPTLRSRWGPSHRRRMRDFKHRFTTGDNVADLLEVLGWAIREAGSLEAFFLRGYRPTDQTIVPGLDQFCSSLLDRFASQHDGRVGPGLQYLLTRPAAGSACKRLNLFLRWMVRKDEVDPGLWTAVDRRKLVVPMDVHMGRLCRILGLYGRKTVSLSTAIQVTGHFARIEPEDPVKYDFALSRIGILEDCTGRQRPQCRDCELESLCLSRQPPTTNSSSPQVPPSQNIQ